MRDWRLGHSVTIPRARPANNDRHLSLDTIHAMSSSERLDYKSIEQKKHLQQFTLLRQLVHRSMKAEEETRLKENANPTEEELYMGAFKEWLEPQVRDAIREMYRKGYATQSSGFHGEQPDFQAIDGHFTIDEATRAALRHMGVEVLRGPEIGVPKNQLITMLRFRAKNPSLENIKQIWDAVAAALPPKSLPDGIHPICDRAEEFRQQYATTHPSLEEARRLYHGYLRESLNGIG